MMKSKSAFRPRALSFVVATALLVAGCGSSSPAAPTTPTPPSAPYSQVDLVVGTGTTATQGRTLTVAYTGWLFDPTKTDSKGTQFDQSASFQFVLSTGSVIAGWDQGILNMRVGGTRRLTIPPNLAYGSTARGTIPANSTLVFDVVLLAVN
jgi:FKBP-type peptidyl-prolyl cis-trans isomerase FkpA